MTVILQSVPTILALDSALSNQSQNTTSNFLTYENATYGISIQYPANWSYQDGFANRSTTQTIVDLVPPIENDPNARAHVSVASQMLSNNNISLNIYARNLVDFFRDRAENTSGLFNVMSATTNSTLLGQQAYSIQFTESTNDFFSYNRTVMEKGTKIGDRMYIISYEAETSRYEDFLPTVQQIMSSFKLQRP